MDLVSSVIQPSPLIPEHSASKEKAFPPPHPPGITAHLWVLLLLPVMEPHTRLILSHFHVMSSGCLHTKKCGSLAPVHSSVVLPWTTGKLRSALALVAPASHQGGEVTGTRAAHLPVAGTPLFQSTVA